MVLLLGAVLIRVNDDFSKTHRVYPPEGGGGGCSGNDVQLWRGGGVKHYNAVYLFNIPMNY